ncbi:hypothetical protein ACQP25_03950 [Microtetraspora malaysiensis]|uniref:hypothetical protein n=1 Tax=Microtetraspora malaysiensis TaxID=161358 RepID=UPI003D8CA602
MTALRVAEQLTSELARHNVPSYLYPLAEDRVAVSVWRGLVARTDGRVIWWTAPHLSRRGRALLTYAFAPQTAAKRISGHYLLARAWHPEPSIHLAEIGLSEGCGPRPAALIGGPA